MSEWRRGKTVDLLSVLMNDPEARKDPRLRAVIRRLRAEHRQIAHENAQTMVALADGKQPAEVIVGEPVM
jgi:hypothetical protein